MSIDIRNKLEKKLPYGNVIWYKMNEICEYYQCRNRVERTRILIISAEPVQREKLNVNMRFPRWRQEVYSIEN